MFLVKVVILHSTYESVRGRLRKRSMMIKMKAVAWRARHVTEITSVSYCCRHRMRRCYSSSGGSSSSGSPGAAVRYCLELVRSAMLLGRHSLSI